ncbi:MAG: hypothetical protein AMXMBFR12_01400 [Candidatus Babeliales bacterium]
MSKNDKKTFNIGQVCPESGVYRIKTNCNCLSVKQHEIPLVKGKKFPPCRNCDFEVIWELVRKA